MVMVRALNSGWCCRYRLFHWFVLLLDGRKQELLPVRVERRLVLEDFNFRLGCGPRVVVDGFAK